MSVRNNKGSALIFTLMVLLILSFLGIAILEISLYEYKVSKAYENNISANYSAEAGLDIARGAFNQKQIDIIKQLVNDTASSFIIQCQVKKLPIYPEILYQAIYNVVRNYIDTNIIELYNGNQYDLNNGESSIFNQTLIKNSFISDSYIYNKEKPLPKFTVQIESEGKYGQLVKYGYAILILDLNNNDQDVLKIGKWIINNVQISN